MLSLFMGLLMLSLCLHVGLLQILSHTAGGGDVQNLLAVDGQEPHIRHGVRVEEVVELALVILLPSDRDELHILNHLLVLLILLSLLSHLGLLPLAQRRHDLHLHGLGNRRIRLLHLLGAAATLLGHLLLLRRGRCGRCIRLSPRGDAALAALALLHLLVIGVGEVPLRLRGLDPRLALGQDGLLADGLVLLSRELILLVLTELLPPPIRQRRAELLLLRARQLGLVLVEHLLHAGGELDPRVGLLLGRVRVLLLLRRPLARGRLLDRLHHRLRAGLLQQLHARLHRGHLALQRGDLGLQDSNHLRIGRHLTWWVVVWLFTCWWILG